MKMQRIVIILTVAIFMAGISSFAEDNGDNGTGKIRKNKEKILKDKDNGTTDNQKSKENIEVAKQKRQEAQAQAKEKRDAIREKRENVKKENQETAGDKRENLVDKRQNNQGKRIQHGINKGYLTDDELATLTSQQQKISDIEASFKSDGKLTKDESKQLKQELSTASANIWAEKHDTEGNQMATYRFGKNVFAKDSITSQLSGDISGADAKKITGDFKQMMSIKKKLSTGNLSDEERAKMQSQYDELLNTYFETR